MLHLTDNETEILLVALETRQDYLVTAIDECVKLKVSEQVIDSLVSDWNQVSNTLRHIEEFKREGRTTVIIGEDILKQCVWSFSDFPYDYDTSNLIYSIKCAREYSDNVALSV